MARPKDWRRLLATACRIAWSAGPLALAGTIGLAVLSGVAPIWAAWATAGLIDAISRHASLAVATGHGLSLLGAVLLGATIPVPAKIVGQELRRSIEQHMQRRLFEAVNAIDDLTVLETAGFHDRLRLAQSASFSAPMQIMMSGVTLVRSLVVVVGFGGTLALLGPGFAALAYLTAIPALIGELRLARKRVNMVASLSQRERRRIFYGMLISDPRAVKETKMFGSGDWFVSRMDGEFSEIVKAERALERKELKTQTVVTLPTVAMTGVAVLLSVSAAHFGQLTVGQIAVLLAAVTAIQVATSGLTRELSMGYQSLAAVRFYHDLVAGADRSTGARMAAPALRRGIELRDVWFRYGEDKPWVLRGVNLFIPAGELLAIVGLNGSGKSTLIKIICGLYLPHRGSVTWDGHDLRTLDPATVRSRVAAVFQDFMEYDLTAAENIGIADPQAMGDLARIRSAARVAGADQLIAGLPSGYQTVISRTFDSLPVPDDGAGQSSFLSGGQWQRIAIARAAMRADVDLVVLDEPSAALDPQAESEIHDRLTEVRRDKTAILISHRLNTVRHADLIVVLATGEIVEHGTHDELMALPTDYGRLFATQAADYQDERIGVPVR